MLILEWDEKKRAANIEKHGVDFALAASFDWNTAVIVADNRFDYKEARLVAIGKIGADVFTMVFTDRPPAIRIISLRRASKTERKSL